MSKDPRSDGDEIVNPYNVPRDPAIAGFVGKRKASVGWWPDPNGNRGQRRAAARQAKRKKPRGV